MNHQLLATILLIGTTLLALPGATQAQDALGSGDALDGNLNTQGRRNSPAAAEDYRMRNLVITGNVAGGRGFRGSVGYTADRDFRGSLGSNDLFNFRAGSAFSSPELITMGNAYQQLRFGAATGIVEFNRSGSEVSLSDIEAGGSSIRLGDRADFSRLRLDLDRQSREQSLVEKTRDASEAQPLQFRQDKNGRQFVVSASALRGLTLTPAMETPSITGLTMRDVVDERARLKAEQDQGKDVDPRRILNRPFETRFESLNAPARVATNTDEPRMTDQPDDYTRMLTLMADRYGLDAKQGAGAEERDALLKSLDEKYGDLRRKLTGGIRQVSPEEKDAESRDGTTPGSLIAPPAMPDRDSRLPGENARETTETGETSETTESGDAPSIEDSLRHGGVIDRLSGASAGRFDELMRDGEQSLSAGEYFTAERRFERAIRFNPGHPMAVAGMGHAQLGAGVYISAALTLRGLLTDHPEMIDARFGNHLLPRAVDLDAAITILRTRLLENADPALHGFLLAYVGHQTSNRALVEHGLTAARAAEPNNELFKLLDSVWLAPETAPSGDSK